MKRLASLVVIFLWICIPLQLNAKGYISEYVAKVKYVIDGDTLQVIDKDGRKHKVRIANIDAPELNQSNGQNSRQNIIYLTNEMVEIKIWDLDRYTREVADVFYGQQDIGLKQVQDGYAWVYKKYASEHLSAERLEVYYIAEKKAQNSRNGLWIKRNPTPPWLFRHRMTTI